MTAARWGDCIAADGLIVYDIDTDTIKLRQRRVGIDQRRRRRDHTTDRRRDGGSGLGIAGSDGAITL